jgi:hypothetical protein
MHIAIVTGIGLVVLAVFFFLASLIGKGGPSGAYVFIWVWLVVSIANGTYGVVRDGIPLLNELALSFRSSAFRCCSRGILPSNTALRVRGDSRSCIHLLVSSADTCTSRGRGFQ